LWLTVGEYAYGRQAANLISTPQGKWSSTVVPPDISSTTNPVYYIGASYQSPYASAYAVNRLLEDFSSKATITSVLTWPPVASASYSDSTLSYNGG
jgi:hypothetical protein